MNDRRSSFRRLAEAVVGLVMKRALALRLDAKAQRRALRESYEKLLHTDLVTIGKSPRAAWYAAIRAVTGGGVLDITDSRQEPLPLNVGPRRPRSRRKKVTRAA